MFEKVIHAKIINWYEKNIHESQGGFRLGRGIAEQLSIARIAAELYHNENWNKNIFLGFLDMEKAFDTVWRNAVFYKMNKLKFNEKIIKIISNFYRKTHSRVNVNNNISKIFETTNGVLQGSILSHLLYAIFVNDLLEHVY